MQEQPDLRTPVYSLATLFCQYKELCFLNRSNWRKVQGLHIL